MVENLQQPAKKSIDLPPGGLTASGSESPPQASDAKKPEPKPVGEALSLQSGTGAGSGAAARDDQKAVMQATDPAGTSKAMVEQRKLPPLELMGLPETKRGSDKVVEAAKALTPEEKYFTDLYQHRFLESAVLAKITPVPEAKQGESPQESANRYQKLLVERTKSINEEMGYQDDAGKVWLTSPKFGAATQAAYRDYINWIGQKEVPTQLLTLQSAALPLPPGNPIEVPFENGRRISLDDYDNRIATGSLKADLHVDASKPPTLEQTQKIENALDWSNQARNLVAEANLKRFDAQMAEAIKTLGLPDGWQYREGQDKNAWRMSVAQMVELTTTVGRMANLIDKMHLPIDLPPRAKVTTGSNSSNISLDLPQNLRLNDPETLQKVRALQTWEQEAKPKLEDVRKKLADVAQRPYRALAWGDTTLSKVKGANGIEAAAVVSLDKNDHLLGIVDPTNLHLDPDGKLIDMVDPKKPKPEGETFKSANLLEQRFSATTDPATKDIVVKQTVQAQTVPWWSYENMVYSNVGLPADLRDNPSSPPSVKNDTADGSSERRFKADDLVAVNKGSGTEFMLAKDLEGFQRTQELFHYGGNVLMGTMDAAMLATGSIEISAAFKGARLLAAGVEVASSVTGARVLGTAAKGVWDTSLALGGVSNSAEIQSSSWGRDFAQARNVAFMGTILYGAAATTIPRLKYLTRLGIRLGSEAPESTLAITARTSASGEASERSAADAAEKRPAADAVETRQAESIESTDGLIRTATNGDTVRHFEYSRGADGETQVSSISIHNGDRALLMERSGESTSDWTVKADGKESKLAADITVNRDGSYTVAHVTDERAGWFSKAFYSEKPEEPIVREVTYNLDGSITTKGMSSAYKPPEGSIYRKDARFGEYWTPPDGKQVWVDGEDRIWQERSKGIWQSNYGVLTENKEYTKREQTTAVPLVEPLDWTKTIDGKQFKIHSEAGDMKIMEPNGIDWYVVERDVFDRTYDKAAGLENEFLKRPIRARLLTENMVVENRWGRIEGKVGDYLVTGLDGETYPVKKETFEQLYRRSTSDVDPASFSLPEPTGPPVHQEDGSTVVPYEHGQVTWSSGSDSVTITNSVTGKSDIFSSSDLFSAGTRFYFANGSEERITPAGLRFFRTSEMPKDQFVGEDGAVLQDVPRQSVTILPSRAEDLSPTAFSDGNNISKSVLPNSGEINLPALVRITDGASSHWEVPGRNFKIEPYGTQWEEADGSSYLIDSRSRLWQHSDGKWINNNGTFKVDEQGEHWDWKDGTSNWNDSEGRQWSHTQDMPAKHWRTADGAQYTEGTWQYLKRSKDDAHMPAIVEGLRQFSASQAPLGMLQTLRVGQDVPNSANGADRPNGANTPSSPNSLEGVGTPASVRQEASAGQINVKAPADMELGSSAQAIEAMAHRLMLYATYPMVGQQLAEIATQTKEIVGLELQGMGIQLGQMWSPKDPYAIARSVQDYDAIRPSVRPDLTNKAANSVPVSALGAQNQRDTIEGYKTLFTNRLALTSDSNAKRDQINTLLGRVAHAVSENGTPEEQALLKKELAKQLTFEPWQIDEMERMNGGVLTSQQIQDLMDSDKRDTFANKALRHVASEFVQSRDQDLDAARAMGLLTLAGGSARPLTADIPLGPHYAGHDAFGLRLVQARDLQVDIEQAALAKHLQQNLAAMSSDGRGIAIGDLLLKKRAISPEEFGSVIQNVLNNPDATASEKIHALSDANGPRMAALLGGLALKEKIESTSPNLVKDTAGSAGMTTRFGATLSDFEETLRRTAANDKDPNVRTISAGLLYGVKQFSKDSQDGASILDSITALRIKDIERGQGDFGNDVASLIADASGLPKSPVERANAFEALSLLNKDRSHATASSITAQIKVVRSLADSLKTATVDEGGAVASALSNGGMELLNQQDPALADQARTNLIGLLKLPQNYDDLSENRLISLTTSLPDLMDGAQADVKQNLFRKLHDIVQHAPPAYLNLKSAAIQSLGSLGAQMAIPTLEQTATLDRFPAARLAAFKALEQLHAPNLNTIVAQRLSETDNIDLRPGQTASEATEGDATVLSYLRDLHYRLDGDREKNSGAYNAASGAALTSFQSAVSDRYPDLKSFDVKAQSEWLATNFPLLLRANYDKQVIEASQNALDWQGQPTDTGGDAVSQERQAQFDQLSELAEGSSPAAMQARQILCSMITGAGDPIGSTEVIPTVKYIPFDPMGLSMFYEQGYYKEIQTAWAAKAAAALSKTARPGFAGRDLTARYISMALSSNMQGPAREELLKAWNILGNNASGVRAIPEELYQYVRKLGS